MRQALVVLFLLAGPAAEAAEGEPLPEETSEVAPASVRGFAIQFGAATGRRWADGSVTRGTETMAADSPGQFVTLDFPLTRYLGLQVGASWVTKGVDYFQDMTGGYYSVGEWAKYFMVPLTLSAELPFASEADLFGRLYLRGGVAGDFLLEKGGTWSGGSGTPLDLVTQTTFFDGHQDRNLSLLVGAGVDVGVPTFPYLLVGLDLLVDNHLYNEFAPGSGKSLRYASIYAEFHLTIQPFATAPKPH